MDTKPYIKALNKVAEPGELFLMNKNPSGMYTLLFIDMGEMGLAFFSNRFVYTMPKKGFILGTRVREKASLTDVKEITRETGFIADKAMIHLTYRDGSKKGIRIGDMVNLNSPFGLAGIIYDGIKKEEKSAASGDLAVSYIHLAMGQAQSPGVELRPLSDASNFA